MYLIKKALPAVLLLCVAVCSNLFSAQQKLPAGDFPPKFVYFDSEGNKVRLTDYAGNIPVVVSFFATYCEPCKKEIPFLIEQSKNETLFKVILVVADTGNEQKVQKYLKAIRVTHPYVYDPSEKVIGDFLANEYPYSVYIGKSGKIVSVETGFSDRKKPELIKLIKTLAEK